MKNLLLFLLLIWLLYPQENVQTVFYEDEDYSIYEIYFEKGELNTNNILNRFKDIQVLTIYPYILFINRLSSRPNSSSNSRPNSRSNSRS